VSNSLRLVKQAKKRSVRAVNEHYSLRSPSGLR
jgi:hypothetical protein